MRMSGRGRPTDNRLLGGDDWQENKSGVLGVPEFKLRYTP